MKAIALSLLLILPVLSYQAAAPCDFLTGPEQIISITRVLHPKSYYSSQVTLWQQELEKNDLNENAWLNCYLACRIVNMLNPENRPHDLDEIYENLTSKIKGSYEYHYLTYLHGAGNRDLYPHLEQAYALDPDRGEIYSHMVNYHTIEGNETKVQYFSQKWLETGDISNGILNWNYNALIALEENALLLTNGDNDTYPSWMLQQVHSIRPDVKVVNIHLLKVAAYANRIFDEMNIPNYEKAKESEALWQEDIIPLVDHIFQYADRPVYINVTLPKVVRDSYSDVLYTVGLAFKYSKAPFDNIALLKRNYENKFLLDYLRASFTKDDSATVLNSLNVNYLPAFITLYKHYKSSDEALKAKEIKEVIMNIGKSSGKEAQVLKLLAPERKWKKDVETLMDIKQVDKDMKELRPGLWAATSEVTNESYEQFLMDLLKNKEFDLLDKCKSVKTDWMSLLPKGFNHISEAEAYRNSDPNDPRSPIVNISYEAAVEYCKWLTLAYNAYGKKRKHKKVKFRLPTEEEWEYAAKGGLKDGLYPWGGYYYKNEKGCYLSNFYSSDDEKCVDCKVQWFSNDGGFFTVLGTAYFPNNYGLYGMSGNAAEMVQGGQIAKGGSWEDLPKNCTITSQKEILGKSPAIGFRVFMEVLY